MPTLWFILLAWMLIMYALLDCFDLGAGIIHLLVARTNSERHLVLLAIEPVRDGNEVWLSAAGGALYFNFPLAQSSRSAGLYHPVIVVLRLIHRRRDGLVLRRTLPHREFVA